MDKPKIFIFDLDDTLYQNDATGKLANVVNKQLFEKLDGIKLIFSNATYVHCLSWLNRLEILPFIKAIISCDIIGGYKPDRTIYQRIMSVCNIDLAIYDIVFFDNLSCNLIPAQELGWNCVLIIPYLSKYSNEADNIFSDINDSIIKYTQN